MPSGNYTCTIMSFNFKRHNNTYKSLKRHNDCAELGLMGVQKSYIDASSAQVTAPGLLGGFSFRGLKKLKGGDP